MSDLNEQRFHDWWDGDHLPPNPYPKDSPVFWAWAGWVMGVKAEREACARVCEGRFMGDNNREDMEAQRCAAAIRTRGEVKP